MSTAAQVAQAKGYALALKTIFGVEPKIYNDNIGPTVYYEGANLATVQKKIAAMVAKENPAAVRVQWGPMLSTVAVQKTSPYLLGIAAIGIALMVKGGKR